MCPALLYTGYDDLLSIISDYFDINRFLSVSVDLVRVSGQYVKFDDACPDTPLLRTLSMAPSVNQHPRRHMGAPGSPRMVNLPP